MNRAQITSLFHRYSQALKRWLASPVRRLATLLFGLLLLLSLALARFFTLQVVQGDHWRQLAEKQHLLQIPQPFFRGSFWLSDPQTRLNWPLSYDLARFHLYVDCTGLRNEDKKALTTFLNNTFELSPFQTQFINKQLMRASRSRRLLSNLDLDEKKQVERWWLARAKSFKLQRNALYFIQDHVRSHPQTPMLGALVHTTQLLKDEKTNQAMPTGGLELYFDRQLQGVMGSRSLKRTLKHPLATSETFNPAKHGSDIVLTINPRLQAVAEKLLKDALIRFQAKHAWAIAIDPYSGKILCFAQAPEFDIENYAQYFADETLSQQAKLWGVSDAYEPGSVMKPLTVSIALQANEALEQMQRPPLFDPKAIVTIRDGRFPGRKSPLRDTKPVNCANMNLGLQLSSNIYMAKLMYGLVDRLGPTWYRERLLDFGFGQPSGIELPSETAGLVPTPGKINAWGGLEWSTPTPGTLAMGHNILVNSLQLLRAYCALANGGWLIRPTLIQAIYTPVDQQMQLQYVASRDVRCKSPKVLNNEICKRVKEGMSYTLKAPGSCTRADIPRYSVAAKTGTSNKFFAGLYDPNHTISTFIGMVPVQHPRIVLLVCVDEPRYFYVPGEGYNHRSSFCSAPIFRRIMQHAVGILDIPPDYPNSYLPRDPRFDPTSSYWVEENRILQEISNKWNSQGAGSYE